MALFISPHHQILDTNGDPVSGGKAYFYDEGTTNDKTVYQESAESTAHPQPVVADGNGFFPPIYFSGTARVVFKDASDVALPNGDFDPVEVSSSDAPFDPYNSAKTYGVDDIVLSSGEFWISISASNTGNTPSSSPTKWTKLKLTKVWNTNETYSSADLTQGSDGVIYRSLVGSNLGNDPTTDTGANWRREGERAWVDGGTAYTAKEGEMVDMNNSAAAATLTLPASPQGRRPILLRYSSAVAAFSVTVARNGKPIEGNADDMAVDTDGQLIELMYKNDATGWRVTALGTQAG